MYHQTFEKWTEMAKKFQEPAQAIVELNIKTLQSINYLKPEEIASIKKPEELLERHINMVVENGHKTLDYFQKSFQILEQAMVGLVQEAKKMSAEAKH